MSIATLTAIGVDEMTEFVRTLEPEVPGVSLRKAANPRFALVHHDEKAGFVNDGSLIVFTDDVLSEYKEAVLNTCLLAQLVANRQFNRWRNANDWYKCYEAVLLSTGWSFDELCFNAVEPLDRNVTLHDIILRYHAAIATDEELFTLADTMKALEMLDSSDRRLVLFDTQSQALGKGNIQVGTVVAEGNKVIMNLGAFQFSAMTTRFRFLWYNYNTRHTDFRYATQRASLDMELYRQVKKIVEAKLSDSPRIYLGDLHI